MTIDVGYSQNTVFMYNLSPSQLQIAVQDRNNHLVIQKWEEDLELAMADRDKEIMQSNDIIRTLQVSVV